MHIKNKRGQSTVEYVLLVTAVVAVIIAFVTVNNNGGFQAQLNSTLNTATQEMNTDMAGQFSWFACAINASTDNRTDERLRIRLMLIPGAVSSKS